jgi:hypothetical protein
MAKEFAILNVKTSDENEKDLFIERIEKAKALAKSKGVNAHTSKALLDFLLSNLESDSDKLTPRETNRGRISKLVEAQIEINKHDGALVNMQNGKAVEINKRRITHAFIESTLGCSPLAVKEYLDSEGIAAMLEKHHKACNISEHHNRGVARAQKSLERGLATLNGELIDVTTRV